MTSYYYLKNLPKDTKIEELKNYLSELSLVFNDVEILSNKETAKVYFSTAEVSVPNLYPIESNKFKG